VEEDVADEHHRAGKRRYGHASCVRQPRYLSHLAWREWLRRFRVEAHRLRAGLDVLSGDPLPGTRSKVCVCEVRERLSGFVCVEYREWNRLGQVQGLAVDPVLKRRGIASELLHRAEQFVQAEGGRGIYVDTRVTNGVTGKPTSCPSTTKKGSMASST
jgi:ribosomal protein S18 acetylase RimI-like enzyme